MTFQILDCLSTRDKLWFIFSAYCRKLCSRAFSSRHSFFVKSCVMDTPVHDAIPFNFFAFLRISYFALAWPSLTTIGLAFSSLEFPTRKLVWWSLTSKLTPRSWKSDLTIVPFSLSQNPLWCVLHCYVMIDICAQMMKLIFCSQIALHIAEHGFQFF